MVTISGFFIRGHYTRFRYTGFRVPGIEIKEIEGLRADFNEAGFPEILDGNDAQGPGYVSEKRLGQLAGCGPCGQNAGVFATLLQIMSGFLVKTDEVCVREVA